MKERAKAEVHGFARVFYPHPDNDRTRKLATLGLFGLFGFVWGMIGLGYAEAPPYFHEAAILIAIIFGRMWNIEVSRLLVHRDRHKMVAQS